MVIAPGDLRKGPRLFQENTDHFGACGVSPRPHNPVPAVRCLLRKGIPLSRAVEEGPPANQFLDSRRPLFDQHLNRRLPAETFAGTQGIVAMQRDIVFFGGDRHASLSVD